MRLICPNCGAQYEVADDVIPAAGRDVQCSNCGHTWFEHPGASEAAEMAFADPNPPEVQPQVEIEPTPQPEPEPQPEPVAEPAQEYEPEPEPTPEPEPEPEVEVEQPPRQELTSDVADILRQEAEFEQQARAAEQAAIETQPDLGLSQNPDEDRRSKEARDRLSRLRGEPDVSAAVGATMAADAAMPRSELLPDIEEINSSLRPDAAPVEADYIDDAPRKRSGFRRGFMLVVLLALIAVALYIFAPQISAAVPQVEPALTSYVEWVDGLRLWLNNKLQMFVENADGGGDVASDAPPAEVTTDAPDIPAEPVAEPSTDVAPDAEAAPEG